MFLFRNYVGRPAARYHTRCSRSRPRCDYGQQCNATETILPEQKYIGTILGLHLGMQQWQRNLIFGRQNYTDPMLYMNDMEDMHLLECYMKIFPSVWIDSRWQIWTNSVVHHLTRQVDGNPLKRDCKITVWFVAQAAVIRWTYVARQSTVTHPLKNSVANGLHWRTIRTSLWTSRAQHT